MSGISLDLLLAMRHQKTHPPPPLPDNVSFRNRTILITGSSTGLGLASAHQFASLGAAHIILAVRNLSAGNDAADALRTTNPSLRTTVMHVDMLSAASISSFADKVAKEVPRLDIAVLNAGVTKTTQVLVPGTGLEEVIAVNSVGTALLAALLLPKLRQARRELIDEDKIAPTPGGAYPHLIIVSSNMHTRIPSSALPSPTSTVPVLKELSEPKSYQINIQYGVSKLLVMWSIPHLSSLAGPASDPDVLITTTCPGPCRSDLGRELTVGAGWIKRMAVEGFSRTFQRETSEGARVIVGAATVEWNGKDKGLLSGQGVFWMDGKGVEKGELVDNDLGRKLGGKVWREMVELWKSEGVDVEGLGLHRA